MLNKLLVSISLAAAPSHLLGFERDANIIINGPTSSGKSTLLQTILREGIFVDDAHQVQPSRVYILAPQETLDLTWKDFNPGYDVQTVSGDDIIDFLQSGSFEPNSVVVFDDLTSRTSDKKFRLALENMFHVTTHQKHLWTFYVTHNLFAEGLKSIRRNTQTFILFRLNQDQDALRIYIHQLVGAKYSPTFHKIYEDAITSSYGWLRYDVRLRGIQHNILSCGLNHSDGIIYCSSQTKDSPLFVGGVVDNNPGLELAA